MRKPKRSLLENYSESQEADQMDLSPTVSLLISDPWKKRDAFPFQREITVSSNFTPGFIFLVLCVPKMVNASSILAAAKFLELRRKKLIPIKLGRES